MAHRHAPRLEPPLPTRTADQSAPGAVSVSPGQGRGVTSRPAERQANEDDRRPAESAPVGSGAGGVVRGGPVTLGDGGGEEQGETCSLRRCMPDLDIAVSAIDRAHRLPEPNNRVIVRFVFLSAAVFVTR